MFSAIKVRVLTTTQLPAWLWCSDAAGNDPRGDTELLCPTLSHSWPPLIHYHRVSGRPQHWQEPKGAGSRWVKQQDSDNSFCLWDPG